MLGFLYFFSGSLINFYICSFILGGILFAKPVFVSQISFSVCLLLLVNNALFFVKKGSTTYRSCILWQLYNTTQWSAKFKIQVKHLWKINTENSFILQDIVPYFYRFFYSAIFIWLCCVFWVATSVVLTWIVFVNIFLFCQVSITVYY